MAVQGKSWGLASILIVLGALAPAAALSAQEGLNRASSLDQLTPGATGVTRADPALPRPSTAPCKVALFEGMRFDNFDSHSYDYTPPSGCQGPWAKIVLSADFSSTAGRQFDRTASIWLGGVNLYLGTTQEPASNTAPHWHVERDLTDDAALLRDPRHGTVVLGNVVNDTYTGLIQGSAELLFYPANDNYPAPAVPDAIYPLSANESGALAHLNSATAQLSKTFTLPRNIRHAYLDVLAQSQHNDEFWYTCVPDALAAQLNDCGGGTFREVAIEVDGQLAGLAPIYPWIYTGGINPDLWRPIPGIQTLNFAPFRVDLSPFAGLLDDGSSHQISLRVEDAQDYFAVTASLLIYRDPQATQLTGGLLEPAPATSTLTPPTVKISSNDTAAQSSGPKIVTESHHELRIRGYLDTAAGQVINEVSLRTDFSNRQHFILADTHDQQTIQQRTETKQTSRSWLQGKLLHSYQERLSYPLDMVMDQLQNSDNSVRSTVQVRQGYLKTLLTRKPDGTAYAALLQNQLEANTVFNYASNGQLVAHHDTSRQDDRFLDTQGGCYHTTVQAAQEHLLQSQQAIDCPDGQARLFWKSHPDGSPDSGAWAGFRPDHSEHLSLISQPKAQRDSHP